MFLHNTETFEKKQVNKQFFGKGRKMKKVLLLSGVLCLVISSVSFADTFAAGTANEFSIDFIPISGDTNPTSGYGIVNNDYRMGIYEITNAQWAALRNSLGVPVTGSPSYAYDESPYFTGASVPTTEVSWYEAAQFVNWLNIDAGYDPAYQFTGTQGTGDYTLTVWDGTDTGYDASNPYRNSGAHYFLPTEDEWVKAAYWNGTNLQTWATVGDVTPTQAGWNFDDGYATEPYGPWAVGSGSEELNGTFDMMGNV
jgi:formylglycine-generating enzyme required for sulfatase activity